MRIILTQAEIEEAIEKLVLDQVAVPDDMRIDIDLKATRGEEGYQAFIDIVAHDAPDDGSDRSVDPRVEVLPGAETLDIAAKVLEAKEAANRPRRRGRPAGARNLPKHPETAEADKLQVSEGKPDENKAEELISETVVEQELEPAQEPQEATVQANEDVLVLDSPIVEEATKVAAEPAEEVIQAEHEPEPEHQVAEKSEPVIVPEIFNEQEAPVPEAETQVEEDVDYIPTPETKGFETNQSEDEVAPEVASEEVVEHVPAATVNETDVTSQEPELEAEAQAEIPAPAPTKSLFANLVRPNRD